MWTNFKRFLTRFFRKSRSINNQPLNKVSLIVIIIVDLFILANVFTGLDDISQWPISPAQAYPCVTEWNQYRTQKQQDKDYALVQASLNQNRLDTSSPSSFKTTYKNAEINHLGQVSLVCLQYAELKDKVNTVENRKIQQTINQKQSKISSLKQANNTIRSQYDSTLLEKIAGQGSGQSIKTVSAEKAQQTLVQNNQTITNFEKETAVLKNRLRGKTESQLLFSLIHNESSYQTIQQGYQHRSFWYPSIQLSLQALFLLPLIAVALFVHRAAVDRGTGLIALISWHLLVIFFIPLLLKVFEFLQIGVIFKFLFDLVSKLFGGLVFLISYLYIFLIPLVGFAIIKLSQRFVFNRKVQSSSRFNNGLCLNCALKIRAQDICCPHCGYNQYLECQHCHEQTYQHLPHCRHCGHLQEPAQILNPDLPADAAPEN